jgi:hypothetical protein
MGSKARNGGSGCKGHASRLARAFAEADRNPE